MSDAYIPTQIVIFDKHMTQMELPRTINLDSQCDLGKAFSDIFPNGSSSHLADFRGSQAIGYKQDSHRKVTDTLSMTHGNILYGMAATTGGERTVCALPAKVLFSMDKQALESLEETDKFLEDQQEYIRHSTPFYLRHSRQTPYKKQHKIIEIKPESGLFKDPPLSQETVYACLYLPDKAVEKKMVLPSGARLATQPPPKPSVSGYQLQLGASRAMMHEGGWGAFLEASGLNAVDVYEDPSASANRGKLHLIAKDHDSTNTLDWNARIHHKKEKYINGCAYRDAELVYGIKREDGKVNHSIPLYTRPVRLFFSDSAAALDNLPQTTSWHQDWISDRRFSKSDIDENELTLIPVTETAILPNQNLYVRAFATNGLIRTKNRVPKLDVFPGQDEEKKAALARALSDYLALPEKYKKLHLSLRESKFTENINLLSGGRSGTFICHFNASLNERGLKELMEAYRWNPDFKDAIEEKGLSLVVRIAGSPKQKAMLEQHALVQKKLWDAGFPVPRTDETGIIPYYEEDTGQSIYVEAYMRGRHSDNLESVHLSALGENLGKLHASGIELPTPKVRNVLDEDVLFNDAIWALDNIDKIACPDNDERADWLPTYSEIYDSIVKELLNRFSTNDKKIPAWAYINIKQPGLASRLRSVEKEVSQASQEKHLENQEAYSSISSHLPHSSSCWNDAHLGNLILHDDGITMLDFGNSGEGIPAHDLELSSFSACVDEEGRLTSERTLPFFLSYIFARKQAAEEHGTHPVTQEEIIALPKLLAEASRGRELAIIAMYKDRFDEHRDDPTKQQETQEEYYRFIKRIKALREQMSEFMNAKEIVTPADADRFAQTFFGMSLEQFPPHQDLSQFSPKPERIVPPALAVSYKHAYSPGMDQPVRKSLLPFLESEQFQKTDLVLADMWGIINNDTGYYPAAIKTIKQLRSAGKKIVFLSNSPFRNSAIEERLKGFGLEKATADNPGDYDAVITSGDMMYEHFAHENASLAKAGETQKYLLIGNKEPSRRLLSELEQYIATTNPEEADFILCTSAPDNKRNPADDEDLNALLQQCASRKPPLKFYNANPDIQCSDSSKERIYCGGSVAKQYAEMAGEDEIITYGKPARKIHDKAVEAVGLQHLPDYRERVVAIGDSLQTDIKGAKAAGFYSILIRNDDHYHEMPEAGRIRATDEKFLRGQFKHYELFPDLIVNHFTFSDEKSAGVIPDYDKAIVNVGGVLKDDQGFFDDAIIGIRALRQHGKDVLIVSNTPYRASHVEKLLEEEQLYPEKDFTGILTAGDMAYAHFAATNTPNSPKYYCLISGDEDSAALLDPLKGYVCLNPNSTRLTNEQLEMADFVLCTSAPDKTKAPQDYFQEHLEMIAQKCLKREQQGKKRLVFYDVNSDFQTPQRDNSIVHCGGEIANLLEKEHSFPSENIVHFGKPDTAFYQECIRMLSCNHTAHGRQRIISFDDSIRNTVGAHSAKIVSAKVGRRGYHTAEPGWLSPLEGMESCKTGSSPSQLPAAPEIYVPEFSTQNILPPTEQEKAQVSR